MTGPVWSASGLEVRPTSEWDRAGGVLVRRSNGATWLGPELCHSLAGWLLWQAGDRPGPADPDAVRLAVDEARRRLRERSSAAETTEDFRAGLAWADHELNRIAEAAS